MRTSEAGVDGTWSVRLGLVGPRSGVLRTLALLAVVLVGASYRLYLARFNTEVGIPGIARWSDYILENARRLVEGRSLRFYLYPPGQSYSASLLFRIFAPTAAVLRVGFGLLDSVAIVFLFLLIRELWGWWPAILGSLAYALWPEGASASVNILHEHSPQPLLLFSGFWLLVRWTKTRVLPLLPAAGVLLGLLQLFRTDGLIVLLIVSAMLAWTLRRSGERLRRAFLAAGILVLSGLSPGLAYDLFRFRSTGSFVHVGAGDVGSAVFLRFGRNGGIGGTRVDDFEVAQISGVSQPFGRGWWDPVRFRILGSFGRQMLVAAPLRYLEIVGRDSLVYLREGSAAWMWLPPGAVPLGQFALAGQLRNPEWPLAVLVSFSRIQAPLASRGTILTLTAIGLVAGLLAFPRETLLVAAPMCGWILALLALLPRSNYLTMPLCLAFVPVGLALALPVLVFRRGLGGWRRAFRGRGLPVESGRP